MTVEKSITHIDFSYADQDISNEASLLIKDILDMMDEEKYKTITVGDVTVDYDTLCRMEAFLTNIDTYHIGTAK